jgi:hypothetical protein
MEKFKDRLSTRSKNGISRCFGLQVLDTPEIIAKEGVKRLKKTNQLGTVSLEEIANMLYDCGYIESPEKWLID